MGGPRELVGGYDCAVMPNVQLHAVESAFVFVDPRLISHPIWLEGRIGEDIVASLCVTREQAVVLGRVFERAAVRADRPHLAELAACTRPRIGLSTWTP